ncbi:hypothetical protein KOY49_01650 [Candidatus Minimicrobia vallesae]|uniref:DUF1980 domain-containing protein n=1 Tax=Candidatus Minimicrobia vallesae TaxID=2841264 RepID=A0A8F1MBB6_9BACT|nr:hypothetical protein [Candidatus Minimicrobia vallesae]QWQ31697.1 hypothetical protein KOY49_01650 [Candidatus Minimicrobia vallesae]
MYANLAKSIGGIVVCVYILLLAWRDQLGFYVHPRYHTFAVVISVIGVILLLIDIMLQLKNISPATDLSLVCLKITPISYFAIIILSVGYILPPKPLSPSSLAQKESPAIIEPESRCETPQPKEGSSTISINRWKTAINSCKEAAYFNGKDITVTGFVSNDLLKNYGYNYFNIARYVISCCTVDSVPMKILVEKSFFDRLPRWNMANRQGYVLSQKIVNSQAEYVITDVHITKISQPKYPYELLGL